MKALQESIDDLEFFCECGGPAPEDPMYYRTFDRSFRHTCRGEKFYKGCNWQQYCVLHYPALDKTNDFTSAIEKKLQVGDFIFDGVFFPINFSPLPEDFYKSSSFAYAIFNSDPWFSSHPIFNGIAIFSNAKFTDIVSFYATFNFDTAFSNAIFYKDVEFHHAGFNGDAFFSLAKFKGEAGFYTNFSSNSYFRGTVFDKRATFSSTFDGKAHFNDTIFDGTADFSTSSFNADAEFSGMELAALVFDGTNFKEKVLFSKLQCTEDRIGQVQPGRVLFKKPEAVSFHSSKLAPHWFIYTDPRKFSFVDAEWLSNPKHELKRLHDLKVISPARLLSITYRNLAINAEENHRYGEAQRFRYASMNIRRMERFHGLTFWTLDWWYWAASGYGEKAGRAFAILVGIWLLFSIAFHHIDFVSAKPLDRSKTDTVAIRSTERLDMRQALNYSLSVLTLQRPDPKPTTSPAQELVTLEMILGPVQAALLALAIRRKFMR